VPLDYVQIGEVLANLVENAAKYTPQGSAIRITARQEDGIVRVAVQDNGPGIPAEALPHVFEKFYRVSGGDRATIKGTGLGLAVARGFVEAHSGSIEVQSPPPGAARGSEFSFRLPLRPMHAIDGATADGAASPAVEGGGEGNPLPHETVAGR
jgi:signal transduction histidine kinase